MKTLTTVQGDPEALVIQQLLESNGIPVMLICPNTQSVFPLSMDGLGGIAIQVEDEHLEEARALLAEFRQERREGESEE